MSRPDPAPARPLPRLGPATITAVAGPRQVVVDDGEGPREVALALAGDYTPRVGDELLVIVDDGGNGWAIGVIRSLRPLADGPVIEHDPEARRTIIRAIDGDLELVAESGSVRIAARDRIDLRGALLDALVGRVQVRAEAIEARADRLVERLREAYRDVEGLAQVHAGRVRTLVDDTIHTLGRRILTRARGDHKLQGEKIHIG